MNDCGPVTLPIRVPAWMFGPLIESPGNNAAVSAHVTFGLPAVVLQPLSRNGTVRFATPTDCFTWLLVNALTVHGFTAPLPFHALAAPKAKTS